MLSVAYEVPLRDFLYSVEKMLMIERLSDILKQ